MHPRDIGTPNSAPALWSPSFTLPFADTLKRELPPPRRMPVGRSAAFALCVTLASCATAQDKATPAADGVQISKLDDRLRVEINGKLFTEYHFKDVPQPDCYPVLGPGGV